METDFAIKEKIVIGKTWAYVLLALIAALLIYLYREHQKPPTNFKEPSAFAEVVSTTDQGNPHKI